MELNKLSDYRITLCDIVVVEKASRFVSPIVPIGFVCNQRGMPFCIIKKSRSGEVVSFSDMSLSEGSDNICYMFFKNKPLKKQMLTNLIEMFDAGVVYVRLIIPFGICEKEYLKGVEFTPVFARFQSRKVQVLGKRLGVITKRERFCFDGFVELADLYMDVDLLDGKVGDGSGEREGGEKGGNGKGSVKMEITKKRSVKLLSDDKLTLGSNSSDE